MWGGGMKGREKGLPGLETMEPAKGVWGREAPVRKGEAVRTPAVDPPPPSHWALLLHPEAQGCP